MKDYITKAIAYNDTVRIYAASATNTVNEAQKHHQTWPTATAALGRVLIVGGMMGAMLKGKEKLTIRVKGDGPIGEILVNANAQGKVKGYASNPAVHYQYPNGKLDVAKAVGSKGELQVIKDLGLKEHFTSNVELISGELGEDFTYYFAKSEQTPASVACGVIVETDNTVKAAGGFIVQVMPGIDEEVIGRLEQVLVNLKPVSQMIDEGYTPEDIIKEIVGEEEYTILATSDLMFECDCSKERFSRGLVSLGREELEIIVEEDEKAEVVCHFCRKDYQFSKEDLEELLDHMK